jgi:uncharacterized protein YndB with AHSA1/START domain
MSKRGEELRVPAIRFERLLPYSAEKVWDHLTLPRKLAGWHGEDSEIEPREGGRVRLMGGHIRGLVTQWKPPRKLIYTWNVFAPGETESSYPESYLCFELAPRGDQVLLTLFHVPVLDRFEKQNAMGWHTFLDMLESALQGRAVEDRSVYMQRNAQLYGVDLANLRR